MYGFAPELFVDQVDQDLICGIWWVKNFFIIHCPLFEIYFILTHFIFQTEV